ncbi:hypothetical protein NQ318_001761 [Aromia moschata]|uniref:G-protein coupled receptors family 1 profile domain-containing protein n=1 Tax=Aromia moschata TaxID=1265417 RepID=A0AAV8XS56_9CUCU|nr:hypothetical protein NQ318_001761 [Aromia moschata]
MSRAPPALVIIALVYTGMFVSIWRTRNATTIQTKDYEFVTSFFFYSTDGCYMLVAHNSYQSCGDNGGHNFSKTMKIQNHSAWLVVFILPINFALNPILYTFTTLKSGSTTQEVSSFTEGRKFW